MQQVHQDLSKEAYKYLINKEATPTTKLNEDEMEKLMFYNKTLAEFSVENSLNSIEILRKLWNEDNQLLPLYAGSGIFPICAFTKIIVGEFMMNKASVQNSVLWNLLNSYTQYLVLKDISIESPAKLFELLKSTKPTNIAEIWLCTLWSETYKLPPNENINVLNSDGFTLH